MKILIGSDTYYPDVNGASYFAQRLAKGLVVRKHEVHVLCSSRSLRPEVTSRDGATLHGVRSVPVPFHAPFRFSPPPFLHHRVLREVKRIEPDVVHVQSHFFIGRTLIHAADELGIPTIATNHFMPDNLVFYLGLPGRLERAVMDLAWRDFAGVFNRADLVTAPTPFAARLAEEKGIDRQVIPISCGIDLNRFSPRNGREIFRSKYSIPDRRTYMYVGRLDAEKRVGDLIDALPLIHQTLDAQLLIVGDGHQRRELVELARSKGVADRVFFTSFVEDEELPGAYAACDVFCNASVAELQSIVTMEAMATGKPVVATNARALPYLVRDGENGHLFEPGAIGTLASQLAGLLADEGKRARMGARSLGIIADHDIQSVFAEFEKLYELAIPSRRYVLGTLRSSPRGERPAA